MLNSINFFTFSLLLTFAIITKVESQDSDFIDFILKAKDFYVARSVIIFTNYAEDVVEEAAALRRQRLLSNDYILSNFVKLENLSDAIDHYHENTNLPLYVVILRSSEDFEMLVSETHRRRVSFACLLIFSTDNETLMSYCTHPESNYFNLNFDAQMLVFCRGEDVPVREWYSIYLNETEVTDITYWKDKNFEKIITNDSLYKRRNSLKGISLRSTGIKKEFATENGSTGYFSQILNIISQRGNFVVDLQLTEDTYGIYNRETRKWNGIMEKLVNNETDLGLGEWTITSSRLSAVDFLSPIVISRVYYYIKKPKDLILPWNMYYLAFGRSKPRLVLSMLLLLLPFLIAWIKIENIKISNRKKKCTHFSWNILDCYLEVWTIFCRMPLTNFPETLSLRLVYFSIKIFTLFIFAIYSAVFTSYLSHLQPMLPFNSVGGLIKDGSYKILVIKDSNFAEIFENSTDDTINKLKKFLVDNEDLPIYLTAALSEVCYGEKFVIIMDQHSVYSYQISSSCKLVAFHVDCLISNTLAFSKNNPYLGFFNHYIQKLRDGGILQRLMQLNQRSVKIINPIYDPISIYSAVPIFAILAVGMILSLIVLMCEYTVYYVPFHKLITASKKPKNKKLLQLSQQRTMKSINTHRRRNDSPNLYPFTN